MSVGPNGSESGLRFDAHDLPFWILVVNGEVDEPLEHFRTIYCEDPRQLSRKTRRCTGLFGTNGMMPSLESIFVFWHCWTQKVSIR